MEPLPLAAGLAAWVRGLAPGVDDCKLPTRVRKRGRLAQTTTLPVRSAKVVGSQVGARFPVPTNREDRKAEGNESGRSETKRR